MRHLSLMYTSFLYVQTLSTFKTSLLRILLMSCLHKWFFFVFYLWLVILYFSILNFSVLGSNTIKILPKTFSIFFLSELNGSIILKILLLVFSTTTNISQSYASIKTTRWHNDFCRIFPKVFSSFRSLLLAHLFILVFFQILWFLTSTVYIIWSSPFHDLCTTSLFTLMRICHCIRMSIYIFQIFQSSCHLFYLVSNIYHRLLFSNQWTQIYVLELYTSPKNLVSRLNIIH